MLVRFGHEPLAREIRQPLPTFPNLNKFTITITITITITTTTTPRIVISQILEDTWPACARVSPRLLQGAARWETLGTRLAVWMCIWKLFSRF